MRQSEQKYRASRLVGGRPQSAPMGIDEQRHWHSASGAGQPAASLCSVRYRCDALDSALGGGDAKHFQSTDDAYIAARQTALAPKVSGYITTVPVTDDEHVATGDVIARIDDRDYRIRRRRHKSLNERAEGFRRKALLRARCWHSNRPRRLPCVSRLSRQLRARAEQAEAFERVAYLRQGILVAGTGLRR